MIFPSEENNKIIKPKDGKNGTYEKNWKGKNRTAVRTHRFWFFLVTKNL